MNIAVPEVLNYITNNFNVMSNEGGSLGRGKKRRLDHLTWEEKLQRKKLKNRVAAQTSRDRKKARMEQMEADIKELMDKHDKVLKECENLRLLNERLTSENAELYKKLQEPCPSCCQNRSVDFAAQNRLLGSAESSEINPLQKGVLDQQQSATTLAPQQQTVATALWKIVLACLLYQTCSTNSTEKSTFSHLSNSLRASYKISPQTLKQLLQQQILKNQKLVNTMKWWGRHQNAWNPVDVAV